MLLFFKRHGPAVNALPVLLFANSNAHKNKIARSSRAVSLFSSTYFATRHFYFLPHLFWALVWPNLHQVACRTRRSAAASADPPIVQYPHLLHAAHRAPWRASFMRVEFPMAHLRRVFFQRHARIPALLRAPMHQPIFANVQIPRSRAALPIVLPASRHIVLKIVEPGERPLPQRHDLFKNFLVPLAQAASTGRHGRG